MLRIWLICYSWIWHRFNVWVWRYMPIRARRVIIAQRNYAVCELFLLLNEHTEIDLGGGHVRKWTMEDVQEAVSRGGNLYMKHGSVYRIASQPDGGIHAG